VKLKTLNITYVATISLLLFTSFGGSSVTLAATLYWTEGGFSSGEVKRAPLSNPGSSEIISSTSDASTVLAVDNGQIYWTGDGTLRRSNLDGSAVDVLSSGFGFSEGVALNTNNNSMYWTTWSGTIQMSNLDGTDQQTIFTDSQQLFGLAIDATYGYLYWTANDTGIYRSNLDGTDVQYIVDGGIEPLGIALDVNREKMYWADWQGQSIWRANVDGTGVERLYNSASGLPIGITLDLLTDKVYWSEWGSNNIMRANLDGTSVETLHQTTNGPWGLAVVTAVPIPAAIWLFGSGLLGLTGLARRKTNA
jgi:sugar lactone lactonase YvrE